jgi:hypothetical protein
VYLAQKQHGFYKHYCLRQSFADGDRFLCRELYDLGVDPAEFIIYPGGNSFYFHDKLIQSLTDQGVGDADRKLERIMFPFLPPEIQRIIQQVSHFGRKKRVALSRDAMTRKQSHLHLFDRRRLFYLRFGRMDSPAVLMRPHKFLNQLIEMSRDEIEHHFQKLEYRLRLRERKNYVYAALDLGRHFPGDFARLFPAGLDPEKLDQTFLSELCQLSRDPAFQEGPPDYRADPERLSDYLVRYAILWFDFDFGQKPPQRQIFEEFVRSRAHFQPPPPRPTLNMDKALQVFALSRDEHRQMSRTQITRIYRRQAMSCHPDQGGESDKFIELQEAYEVLTQGK